MITERLLNKKRHTIGFAVGSTEYTRAQTIRLARAGEIAGVKVCKGPRGPYLTSTIPSRSLYSLPARVVGSLRKSTGSQKLAAAKTASKGRKSTAKKSTSKPSTKSK